LVCTANPAKALACSALCPSVTAVLTRAPDSTVKAKSGSTNMAKS